MILQASTLIITCVAAILLSRETHIVYSDGGRLLLTIAVALTVVTSPVVDAMVVDRLLSACIGGYAMHRILGYAFGPAPYRVLRRAPVALLDVNRSAYRMQFGIKKVVTA